MKKWKSRRVKEFFHFSTHTIARVRIYIECIMTMRRFVHTPNTPANEIHTCNWNVSVANSTAYTESIEHKKNAHNFCVRVRALLVCMYAAVLVRAAPAYIVHNVHGGKLSLTVLCIVCTSHSNRTATTAIQFGVLCCAVLYTQ